MLSRRQGDQPDGADERWSPEDNHQEGERGQHPGDEGDYKHDLGCIFAANIMISRHFFLSDKNIHDISSLLKVEGDCIETENVLTLKDGTEIVSKEKFTKME